MTPPGFVENIFNQLVEMRNPADRQVFLAEVCKDQPILHEELVTLLHALEDAQNFLKKPDLIISPPDAPGCEPQSKVDLPGYRIIQQIGEGGGGQVYEAYDLKLERTVAIKVLHHQQGSGRLLSEARKAAGLRDPAIVTIHAIIDDNNPPAIVMEHIKGFPIDHLSPSLSFKQRAKLLQEISRALAVAHNAGIVHRDLKPANILVRSELRPVLLDFGLAIFPHSETSPHTFEGTPLYASPEQARGEPLSTASDIFSFGALMFLVLTGKTAFRELD